MESPVVEEPPGPKPSTTIIAPVSKTNLVVNSKTNINKNVPSKLIIDQQQGPSQDKQRRFSISFVGRKLRGVFRKKGPPEVEEDVHAMENVQGPTKRVSQLALPKPKSQTTLPTSPAITQSKDSKEQLKAAATEQQPKPPPAAAATDKKKKKDKKRKDSKEEKDISKKNSHDSKDSTIKYENIKTLKKVPSPHENSGLALCVDDNLSDLLAAPLPIEKQKRVKEISAYRGSLHKYHYAQAQGKSPGSVFMSTKRDPSVKMEVKNSLIKRPTAVKDKKDTATDDAKSKKEKTRKYLSRPV